MQVRDFIVDQGTGLQQCQTVRRDSTLSSSSREGACKQSTGANCGSPETTTDARFSHVIQFQVAPQTPCAKLPYQALGTDVGVLEQR